MLFAGEAGAADRGTAASSSAVWVKARFLSLFIAAAGGAAAGGNGTPEKTGAVLSP
jgi:hypothetical protein